MHLSLHVIYLPLLAARPVVRLALLFFGLLAVTSAVYHYWAGFEQIAIRHVLWGLGALIGVPAYEYLLYVLDTGHEDH